MKAETILVEYALKEEEDQERSSDAVAVLERWGGEYTAEKMIEVIEKREDIYLFLRIFAVEILGEIYHPRSKEVLERLLEKTEWPKERKAILKSLRKLHKIS